VTIDITLYGEDADRFEDLHGRIEDRLGADLSLAQVVSMLVESYSGPGADRGPDRPERT